MIGTIAKYALPIAFAAAGATIGALVKEHFESAAIEMDEGEHVDVVDDVPEDAVESE